MKRYRVDFTLAAPVCANIMPIMSDSVLAYALVKGVSPNAKLPDKEHADLVATLPIRKVQFGDDYLFAASGITMNAVTPGTPGTIVRAGSYPRVKSLYLDRPEVVAELAKHKTIDQQGTEHKKVQVSYETVIAKTGYFVVDTDAIDAVMALFRTIDFIGKKSSIGYGKIRFIEDPVEVGEETPIVRPLPADFFTVEAPISEQRLKPAYYVPTGRYRAGTGRL